MHFVPIMNCYSASLYGSPTKFSKPYSKIKLFNKLCKETSFLCLRFSSKNFQTFTLPRFLLHHSNTSYEAFYASKTKGCGVQLF